MIAASRKMSDEPNLGEYDPAKRHHQYTPNYNKYNQNTSEQNIS